MDGLGPFLLGLHDPLESDRMALGHVRALDNDAVRVLQVLLEGCRSSPAKRCPQTGNGGAVSYAGLVLDLDGSEGGKQLLDEVVLLVVESGPSQAGDTKCPADPEVAVAPLPGVAAGVEE